MLDIRDAALPDEVPVVRQLFREYAAGVGSDLCFRGFEAELAGLPGPYAPPRGRLLLAWNGTHAAGCVALQPVDDDACEMKRLFVRPEARGSRLGRRLAQRLCDEARVAGYRRIRLETLPAMAAAIRLYASLGFRPVAPYAAQPVAGALHFGLDL
jgi:ribosomal protein S18 acetylase RimI-like enzyme